MHGGEWEKISTCPAMVYKIQEYFYPINYAKNILPHKLHKLLFLKNKKKHMGWYLNSKQNNSQKSPSAVRSLLEQWKVKLSPVDDVVEDSGLMEDVVLHSHMQQATVEICIYRWRQSLLTIQHYQRVREMITDPGQREKGRMWNVSITNKMFLMYFKSIRWR